MKILADNSIRYVFTLVEETVDKRPSDVKQKERIRISLDKNRPVL
jgi:hypothetical protein